MHSHQVVGETGDPGRGKGWDARVLWGGNLWLVAEGRYESLEECGARVGLKRLGLTGLRFGREIGTACITSGGLMVRHIGVASYIDGGGISHTAIRPRERQTLRWLVPQRDLVGLPCTYGTRQEESQHQTRSQMLCDKYGRTSPGTTQ